jgi:hypothetical protein
VNLELIVVLDNKRFRLYVDYSDNISQNTIVVFESGRHALFLNGGCLPPFFLSADQIPDRQSG